jgi:nucleoid-associated protein YgaU
MMTTTPSLSPSSRYAGQPAYAATGRDGAAHATLPARPLPAAAAATPYLHTLVAGETIESLAARFLSSSELWWQIADANPRLFPTDIRPGTVLAIPTAPTTGLVARTRSF